MAVTFFKALGYEVGTSFAEDEVLETAMMRGIAPEILQLEGVGVNLTVLRAAAPGVLDSVAEERIVAEDPLDAAHRSVMVDRGAAGVHRHVVPVDEEEGSAAREHVVGPNVAPRQHDAVGPDPTHRRGGDSEASRLGRGVVGAQA